MISNKLLCSDDKIQQEYDSQMGRLAAKVLKINSLKLWEITASSSLEFFFSVHCVSEKTGSLLASFWPFVCEIKRAGAIVWTHKGWHWLRAAGLGMEGPPGLPEVPQISPVKPMAMAGKDCRICVFPMYILVFKTCKSADRRLVLNSFAANWADSCIALFIFQSGENLLGTVVFSSVMVLQTPSSLYERKSTPAWYGPLLCSVIIFEENQEKIYQGILKLL